MVPGMAIGERFEACSSYSIFYLVNDKNIASLFISQIKSKVFILPEIHYWKFFSSQIFSQISAFLRTFIQILKLYFQNKIVFILSAGGGASFIPVILLRCLGVKGGLLEQNVIMGKANRFLLPLVHRAYLAFPCSNVNLSKNMRILGNPIRKFLSQPPLSRKEAANHLNLDESSFTLLIMGGSQGAKNINETVIPWIKKMAKIKSPLQIIHLTGPYSNQKIIQFYTHLGIRFSWREV